MKYRHSEWPVGIIILIVLFVLAIIRCSTVHAADLSSEVYCQYDQQKAEAERLLDQSPMLMAGLGRNNSATNNVLAIGVTESLSKYLQGNLSHKIGDADCHLYQVTAEIQKHVTYDLQSLQVKTATERVKFTDAGISLLDSLIAEEQLHQKTGNSTLQNVATLQAARETLVVSKAQLEQQIAVTVLPQQDSHERLNGLLSLAQVYLLDEQHESAKQQALQNWDLSITVGEGSNPNLPMLHSLPNETFATAQFTYSFGASKRTRALDSAGTAYAAAQATASTGPINLAYLLRTEVTRAKDAAKASQTAYQAYDATIQQQITAVAGVDTNLARAFRIQLAVAAVNNGIELASAQNAEYYMTQYLAANFDEVQN